MPIAAQFPENEDARIQALKRYDILDTESENEFDDITSLVSDIFDAPIVLVSLIDSCRQWFKSRVGLEVCETHRNLAFCAHAILTEEVFYIPDARVDERFADSPLVTGAPHIRTYAGAPLQTHDGYRLGTLCVIYDEVHELSAEELSHLQKFARIVMNQIDSRLEHLQVNELSQKAEQENANKSNFVAMISHELRNPMVGMINILEMLQQEKLEKEVAEYINIVHESSQILLALVNDILDFSKLSAGKFTLDVRPFDVRKTVAFTTDLIKQQALQNGSTLKTDIDEKLTDTYMGDDVRIRQILYNLLSNAVKFSEDGVIKVSVKPSQEDKVLFSVCDSGIGINAEAATRIFQSYEQGDTSISRQYGGTGLGLAICKQLVELMNGEIGVNPNPECGTTFWFCLPLAKVKAGQNQTTKSEDILIPDFQKKLRLLVAEDNPINRKVISKVLTNMNIEATCVSNGQEALEAVQAHTFDALLMDIAMPEMDGIHATQAIRKLKSAVAEIPIIALSANNGDEDTKRYLLAGMNACLEKPIKIAQLVEVLSQMLED